MKLFWREADFAIGGRDDPYLLRWYILPRNRWFNLYLHKFCRDDDDRALHDHPWWFLSLMIHGMYTEIIAQDMDSGDGRGFVHSAPSIAFRHAEHRHRVVLERDGVGNVVPCWTLVLTGPRVREWGFWGPKGFVHWKDFTGGEQGERVGTGCGEK